MVILPYIHPAFDFLCAALRFARGADSVDGLRMAAAAIDDWELVVQGARTHRVLVALDTALAVLPDAVRPRAIAETATQLRRAQAHAALAKAAQLAEICAAFANDGRRVLVLKGIPLALKLYGSIGARGVGDIDLLVAPAEFRAAASQLGALGYLPVAGTLDAALPVGYEAKIREIVFRHPNRRGEIELHQRFAANPLRLATPFETLWATRESVTIGGVEIATLPIDMLGPYLCAHGADHCWERLIWLEDLVRLAETQGGTVSLLAQAHTQGLERPMNLALTLGAGWLGLEPPSDAASSPAAARFVHAFFPGEHALAPPPKTGFRALRRRWRYRRHLLTLKDDWRARAGEIRAVLEDPVDWNRVRLPRGLTWLHVLIRPFGVAIRALRDLRSR